MIVIAVALVITGGSLGMLHWLHPTPLFAMSLDHHTFRFPGHRRAVYDAAALDLPRARHR